MAKTKRPQSNGDAEMAKFWEDFKAFVKEHKTEIGIAVTAICAFGAGYALASSRDDGVVGGCEPDFAADIDWPDNVVPIDIDSAPEAEALGTVACDDGADTTLIEVRGHVRNLPESWSPSAGKLAEAEARGIQLEEHQTIVDSYQRSA